MDPLLNDFLKELNKTLTRNVSILILGGNALILYGAKEKTMDIDICICDKDVEDFVFKYRKEKGIKVDVFIEGIFTILDIPDFLKKGIPYREKKFENLDILIMHPYDIILTKLIRWKEKDQEDLNLLLRTKQIKREELEERYKLCLKNFRGSKKQKEKFMENFNYFIDFFGNLLH